jgi:DNA-binding HxlR family transcriptional regulator
MQKTADRMGTLCPVARSQDVVGDRWSMLILRELFMGTGRFDDLQIQTEATPQMLATRLKKLEADAIVERHAYSERPLRFEYRLTEKGAALYPVILALRRWGETWCKTKEEGIAVGYLHKPCGKDPGLGPTCAHVAGRSSGRIQGRGTVTPTRANAPTGSVQRRGLNTGGTTDGYAGRSFAPSGLAYKRASKERMVVAAMVRDRSAPARPDAVFRAVRQKIAPNSVKKPNLLAYFRNHPHMSGFGSFLR